MDLQEFFERGDAAIELLAKHRPAMAEVTRRLFDAKYDALLKDRASNVDDATKWLDTVEKVAKSFAEGRL